MTSPSTRTLRLYIPDSSGYIEIPQQAIPWCMTHDRSASYGAICQIGMRADCTISTGGPDHKWWRDV